jgi:conjugal transfer pilus assembly protein TraK
VASSAPGGAYQPGAGAAPVMSGIVPGMNGVGVIDQVVKPEVTTAVLVSNRDVNRLVCDDDIQDVVWSEERPVKVQREGSSVLVKFLVQKQGESYTNVSDPVDLHIFCAGAVYTVVLHPQAMDSATVRLIPPVAKTAARLAREWSALPLEDKVQRLTLMAFHSDYPEGVQRKPIFDNDARKHVTLYTRDNNGDAVAVAGVTVTGVYELSAEGTGLKATEYEVRSSQARELRETDFLSPAFGDEVSVTLDPLKVVAGQPARLIVVSRSVEHGS